MKGPLVVCFNMESSWIATDLLTDCRAQLVFRQSTSSFKLEELETASAFLVYVCRDQLADLEFAERLRRLRPQTPSVLVSNASTNGEGPIWALRHGYKDFVEFPKESAYLVKKVKKLVAGRTSFAEADLLVKNEANFQDQEPQGEGESLPRKVEHVLGYLNNHYQKTIRVDDLAAACNLSYETFINRFKKLSGRNFRDHVKHLRVKSAISMLRFTDLPIKEICYRVGYNDFSLFNRVFKDATGLTPGTYRHAEFKRSPDRSEMVSLD